MNKFIKITLKLFVAGVAFLALLLIFKPLQYLDIMGVGSDSMVPTFPMDTYVFTNRFDKHFEIGDVVSYVCLSRSKCRRYNEVTIHRLVRIEIVAISLAVIIQNMTGKILL